MAASNEVKLISQLTDGGALATSTDWFMIDREEPVGTGNYEQYKMSAQEVANGPLGITRISAGFSGSALSSGSYYLFGSYSSATSDANLSNASPTQTFGTAAIMYGSQAFIVCGGVGTTDAGVVELEVSGTSITDDGVLTSSDTEVILTDITALSVVTDAYFETEKKWVGQITFTLQGASGSPTAFSFDFNYGFVNYEPASGQTFDTLDVKGLCNTTTSASDFDIVIYDHPSNGDTTWTYSAAGFDPGGDEILRMSDVMSTSTALLASNHFNFKRSGMTTTITNGFTGRIITGSANAVDFMNVTVGIK